MDLHVRLEGRRHLTRQIYEQIRAAILQGRIRRGERLPPTRELARRLAVSRNTVSVAYEWLVAEGLLSGRRGAGSFVEGETAQARPARPRPRMAIRHRAVWDRIEWQVPEVAAPRFDFRVGMPDVTMFPHDAWRRVLARQFRPARLHSDYRDPAGHRALRDAIARHVAVSRGVRAVADDVIVTNGAQQAFDLIARVLVSAGSTVAVEEPGYPPVRFLFESMEARVVPVPVDASGLHVTALPDDARVVYVTPAHQFPMGMPMSHARRVALLEWAERRNAVIIEDDYDSEFRFGGRPQETLQSIDRGGRVIYVGSFSKSLLPGLRLGFLIAPPSLLRPLRAAVQVAGWFVQWPAQAALATFIGEGLLARHLRRMRRVYAERHDGILRSLETKFTPWLRPVHSVTGIHITATLLSRGRGQERSLKECAATAGVTFDPLSGYFAAGDPQPGIVLGYGGIATPRIPEGLRLLRGCFASSKA